MHDGTRDSGRDSPPPGPSGTALAPVRARYAAWLHLDRAHVLADRDEDPDRIRALQLILRMERDRPPDWYTAVESAARATAAVCLDERAEPGGPWFDAVRDYGSGHIRKVTRRARAGRWQATADLPGVTISVADTEVRALLPGLVTELDKRVAKLQVGGTDAPRGNPVGHTEDPAEALVIHLSPTVTMTLGKSMAQAGHASMIAAALLAGDDQSALRRWHRCGLPVSAVPVERRDWDEMAAALRDPAAAWRRHRLLAVRDAGFTEIDPGTVTVIAIAPR